MVPNLPIVFEFSGQPMVRLVHLLLVVEACIQRSATTAPDRIAIGGSMAATSQVCIDGMEPRGEREVGLEARNRHH